MEIRKNISNNGKAAILAFSVPLEGEYSETLKACVDDLVSKGVSILVLDLSQAEFIAGKGLSVIAYINKKLKGVPGFLVITGCNREISAVFSLLGFSGDCTCVGSIREAEEMVNRASGGTFSSSEQTVSSPAKEKPADDEYSAEKPSATIPEETVLQEGETVFPQPLVVECEECCSFIRVHSSGQFLCPSCHAGFHVERDGTVIF